MPGSYVNTGSPTSLTMAHPGTTAGNEALFAIVAVAPLSSGLSYTGFTRTLTYAGTAMTSLGAVDCSASQSGWVELFYLPPNMSPGTNNLVFTVNTAVSSILMESVSYSGVAQVTPGSVTAVANTGTSCAVSTLSAPNKFVVGGFACSGPILGQQVISTGGATGGTYTLTFNGQTTVPIAYNASAYTVEAALQGLSSIGYNSSVTGSGPWVVTWAGPLAGAAQNLMSINGSGLTGGTGAMITCPEGIQLVLQNISNTESGNLALVDSPGTTSVTLTATTSLSRDWGAVVCSVDAIHTAQADHQAAIDSVVGGISGSSASGNSASTLQTTVSGQQSTVASTSKQMGGLAGLATANVNTALQQSAVGAGGTMSGLYRTIDFSTYANQSTLSGIFNAVGGAGAQIGITGGVASWQSGVTGVDIELYPTATTSDYQIVSYTFGSLNSLTTAGLNVGNALAGRSNAAGTTFVSAQFSNGNVWLASTVSGSSTVLGSVVAHTPVAGALYQLVIGDPSIANLYSIGLLCNGSPIASYNDSGHISTRGPSNRYAGFAEQKTVTTVAPASLSSWAIADNAPPAVLGSGFRAYCSRTSGVGSGIVPSPNTWGAFSLVQFPASTFDTTQWLTSDITFTSSTNTVTVSNAGWYTVTISAMMTGIVSSTTPALALWHNGSLFQCAQMTGWSSGSTPVLQGTFSLYCAANDTLTPGFIWSGSAFAFAGDASGVATSLEVALINRGTLS